MTNLLQVPNIVREHGKCKNYKIGETLQFQDSDCNVIHFMVSGRAAGLVYGARGSESWVNSYAQGQFIGLSRLFNHDLVTHRVVAKTKISSLVFRASEFSRLLEKNPSLMHLAIRDLAHKVTCYAEARIESQELSKRGQIASELKRMAQPDDSTPESYIIQPAPGITDIASRLGVARETVSRTVSEMVKKDILQRHRCSFFVPDLSRLEAQMV